MSTGKALYAIGVSKDWVEIRQANKSPKLHTSTFNKLVDKNVLIPGAYTREVYTPSHWKHVQKMVKFTSSVYTGGKLVATVKSRKFSILTKIRVHTGGILKLTPEMVAAVLPKQKEDG